MTSSTQLTPLQSSGSVIKIDIDSVIQQLLAVKDTPGKQVHCIWLLVLLLLVFDGKIDMQFGFMEGMFLL